MSTDRRRTRRSRRSQRGAAYFEALLVIPVLILVFALLLFVREGYSKAGVSAAETREHGWVNVMDACREEDVPDPTDVEEQDGWSISRLATVAVVLIRITGIIDDQPMLAAASNSRTIGTFAIGERQYSQAETMDRPGYIGGQARYGHRMVLTCDEDTDKLEFPGFDFSLWNMAIWNEMAWQAADL
jgi:hypothetical protein